MTTDIKSVKFRASSVGNLMVGGNAPTEKQLARLDELLARKNNTEAKPLTANMQQELDELIAKRDGKFEFGQTAKSYIRDCWLREVFGYDEPVVSNEMLKGILCEDEAIGVVTRQIPGGFRVKNDEQFENEWFTGCPDILIHEFVEDIKCSWTLRTFVEVQTYDPLYYAQLQVYMDLTGLKRARLIHVLMDTPEEIVLEEQKRFFFRFNCDEENEHYKQAATLVEAMHGASRLVPEPKRVKYFEFSRDDRFLDTLKSRVELAREVFQSLSL